MATTVTETYILEQDEDKILYPTASNTRLQTAIANGTIVSYTKTPIVYPSEAVVAGKAKCNVVIVYRSADDRTNFQAAAQADTELQAYIISSNTRRINFTIS
jgi:hypothetical protein